MNNDKLINEVNKISGITEQLDNKVNEDIVFINVKRFGAKGNANFCKIENGVIKGWYVDSEFTTLANDDTQSIKDALEFLDKTSVVPSKKQKLFFPRGGYYVTQTINCLSGVTIQGGGGIQPRYGMFDNGAKSMSVYICIDENFSSDSIIRVNGNNYSMFDIEIKGNGKNIGLAFRSYGLADFGSRGTNFILENVCLSNNLVGIGAKEYSYGFLRNCMFGDNLNFGFRGINCGDTRFVNCNFDGTGLKQDSQYLGVGLAFDVNCGNSSVIGGKIEYNNIGIYIHCQGIVVDGVQFDNNSYCNVKMYSNDICSSAIFGNCRFLGGGYKVSETKQPASLILEGSNTSLYNFPIELTVTGCSFKTTPVGKSFEYADDLTTSTKALIRTNNAGIKRVTFKSNNIYISNTGAYDVRSGGSDDERSYINTDCLSVHPTEFKGSVFCSDITKNFFRENITTTSVKSSIDYGDTITKSGYELPIGTPTKWLCVRPGTTYSKSISNILVSGDAGNYYVTSSTPIKDYLYVGDYIKVNGSPKVFYKIVSIDYSTNTINIHDSLDTTVANATVSFAQPLWRVVEKILE